MEKRSIGPWVTGCESVCLSYDLSDPLSFRFCVSEVRAGSLIPHCSLTPRRQIHKILRGVLLGFLTSDHCIFVEGLLFLGRIFDI